MTPPALSPPLLVDADVVVAGGGPSGFAAAVAAARQGVRVALLEQTGALGGLGTSGLVPMFAPATDGKRMIYGGLFAEVNGTLARRMGRPVADAEWQAIDHEWLKTVLDEMAAAAGVRVFFQAKAAHAEVRDGRVEAVWCATARGLARATGRQFVDATGDGLLAFLAGAAFELGDENGTTMSPTLCAQFAGVDFAAADAAAREGLTDRALWLARVEAGTAPLPEKHFVGMKRITEHTTAGNLGHAYGVNGADVEQASRGLEEGRRIARVFERFYREQVPGYANARLVNTAALLGVRETRRIAGEYRLTLDDYLRRADFPDEIGRACYPVDIHAASGDPAEQDRVARVMAETAFGPGESYGIPYRALIAKGFANLLVPGRALSSDRAVQSSVRVMPPCFVTGQAAGLAAALAQDGNVRAVDVDELRRRLRALGGYFH